MPIVQVESSMSAHHPGRRPARSNVPDTASTGQLAVDLGDFLRQLLRIVDHRVVGRSVELRQVVGAVAVDGDAVAADALLARFEQGAAGVLNAIAAPVLVGFIVV
jgi:hypothetical protein